MPTSQSQSLDNSSLNGVGGSRLNAFAKIGLAHDAMLMQDNIRLLSRQDALQKEINKIHLAKLGDSLAQTMATPSADIPEPKPMGDVYIDSPTVNHNYPDQVQPKQPVPVAPSAGVSPWLAAGMTAVGLLGAGGAGLGIYSLAKSSPATTQPVATQPAQTDWQLRIAPGTAPAK